MTHQLIRIYLGDQGFEQKVFGRGAENELFQLSLQLNREARRRDVPATFWVEKVPLGQ